MTPLELATDALAAYRLTKLITDDYLLRGVRERVIVRAYHADEVDGLDAHTRDLLDRIQHDPSLVRLDADDYWQAVVEEDDRPPKLAVLVTCRWCAGVWVGLGVVAARRVAPRAWSPIAQALALSAIAGWGTRLE
jgi:hypothetical protein